MKRLSALWTAVVAAASIGFGAPGDLQAQETGATKTEDLIDDYEKDRHAPEADEKKRGGALPDPSVSRVNLDLNWRNWKRSVTKGEPNADQLAQLVRDTRGFGYRNAPAYAAASTRLLREHADTLSLDQTVEAFRSIEGLAPELPSTYLAEARHFAAHQPTALEHLFGAYADGIQRALSWPTTRGLLASYGLLALVVLTAAGFIAVAIGQILRHLPIVTHDLARLLPEAMTRSQIAAALLLAAASLLIWSQSVLVAFLTLLCLASIAQSWSERLVTATATLGIAALPFVQAQILEFASFSDSNAQALLEAQYLRCDQECLEDLERRFETEDPGFRYTAALAILRGSTDQSRQRAISLITSGEVPDDLRGYVANLRGAAQLATGRPKKAIETLKAATETLDDPTAAWFNLMRAHRQAGNDDRASDASNQASRHDVDMVRSKSDFDREDPASYLMLPPLPMAYFRHLHHRTGEPISGGDTVVSNAWHRVAGPHLELADARYLGGGAFGAILLLSLFSVLGLVSAPCPNCGLAREPGDAERTAGHPHCLPCYRTFVGGAELDYKARVHYETLLGRRSTAQMMLRRSLSVLAPGAGHALAGRALSGFALAGILGTGIYLAVSPDWLWRPPRSLAGTDFIGVGYLGWLFIGLGVLVALGSAWRDIEPIEPRADLDADQEAA